MKNTSKHTYLTYRAHNNLTCDEYNAKCDPSVPATDNEPSHYCRCNPGYVWSTVNGRSGCVLGNRVVQFYIEFKNPITDAEEQVKSATSDNINDEQYKTVLKQLSDQLSSAQQLNKVIADQVNNNLRPFVVENRMKQIMVKVLNNTDLNPVYKSLTVIGCQELAQSVLNCSFALNLDPYQQSYDDWTQKLTDPHFCISYNPKDTEHCFFPLTQESPSTYDSNTKTDYIVINKAKLLKTKFEIRKVNKFIYPFPLDTLACNTM